MNFGKISGIVCLFLVTFAQGTFGQENSTTKCLCLQDVIPQMELKTTVRMKPFPDGSRRILLAEKIGVLWIYSENFTRQPEPLANLSHLIDDHELDCALQGVAIHPNFPEDGRIFVNFNKMDLLGDYATLRQYSVYPDNPDEIDMDSEVILIERNRRSNGFSAHSGGEVFFNTDGYLHVIYGDGAQGDPLYISQNRGEMRGKLLRLDVDNVPEGQTYGIPPDNPFIDEEGTLPEIYALGFRQPWTISVDPGDPETGEGAGRVFVADCGQRSWEEIDLIVKGGNYGWSSREGFACYRHRYCGKIGPEELPIAAYRHDRGRLLGWCAISGHVYHGSMNPGLKNAYIHGDSGTLRNLYVMRESPDGEWSHDRLPLCDLETCAELGLTNSFLANVVSFGTDSYGEQYILTSTTWDVGYGAAIQRLIDPETFLPE